MVHRQEPNGNKIKLVARLEANMRLSLYTTHYLNYVAVFFRPIALNELIYDYKIQNTWY